LVDTVWNRFLVFFSGIIYVVDTGVAKEKSFDPVKNVSSLRIQAISQSSAQQRAGRAGRTQPGICYRLYSEDTFSCMRPSSVPEIKRLQMGQAVLRLLSLGISRPENFDYIESPGEDNIRSALGQLAELGAVSIDWVGQVYQLTELGAQMARLPVVPRLAKFLLMACNEEHNNLNLAGDALVISALASISSSVFFRMGSPDGVQLADQQKIQFCSELGDFITMLELFKEWVKVPENSKSEWCVANSINAKSMRIARDTMKDIKASLPRDVGVRVEENREPSSSEVHLRLSEFLFHCFRENLCTYTGHPKIGYINLRTRAVSRLHPSTSLFYLGNIAPNLIIYDQVRI
jgi:ATP-dependent RNA helicase DHX8/PRP22